MITNYSEEVHSNGLLPQKRFSEQISHESSNLSEEKMMMSKEQKISFSDSPRQILDTRDRYIPSRATSLLEFGLFENLKPATPHEQLIVKQLLGPSPKKILSFGMSPEKKSEQIINPFELTKQEHLTGFIHAGAFASTRRPIYEFRSYKIIDSVGLYSDFYSHLLTWSQKNRLFTVLANTSNQFVIYSLTMQGSGSVYESQPMATGIIACSIKAFGNSDVISGWQDGQFNIHTIDENRLQPKHQMKFSDEYLNCLGVIDENNIWVGSKMGWLNGYDLRQKQATFRFSTNTNSSMSNDILAGIAFNYENLVAVGTNFGMVKIWDKRRVGGEPYFSDALHNQSGIKALAFNPHAPKELVSGGGNSCKHVIFRNILSENIPQKTKVGCQVTGIAWLEKKNHFVSTTGYNSQLNLFKVQNHQIELLSQTNLSKADVTGRAIYLTSYRNQCAVAYDGDETITFYNIDGMPNVQTSDAESKLAIPGLLKTTGSFSIR